jgi:hypothetical protein
MDAAERSPIAGLVPASIPQRFDVCSSKVLGLGAAAALLLPRAAMTVALKNGSTELALGRAVAILRPRGGGRPAVAGTAALIARSAAYRAGELHTRLASKSSNPLSAPLRAALRASRR